MRAIAELAISTLDAVIPKRNSVVIRAFPDFDDTTRAIVAECGRRGVPIHVLVSSKALATPRWCLANNIRIHYVYSVQGVWNYLRSRYLVFTHGVFGGRAPRGNRVSINVWHGMTLKRIGKQEDPSARVPRASFMTVTSTLFTRTVSESFGVPTENVLTLGLPRNDVLFAARGGGPGVNVFGGKRYIVYMPTYRTSSIGQIRSDGREGFYADTVRQLRSEEMRKFLAKLQVVLVLKPHPLEAGAGSAGQIAPHLWEISDGWLRDRDLSLYEVLANSEGLITDYSSVYIDYLLTDKPIYFYVPDLEEYAAGRGFTDEFDPLTLPGSVSRTMADLMQAINRGEQDIDSKRRRLALNVMHSHVNGRSAERLLDAAFAWGGK